MRAYSKLYTGASASLATACHLFLASHAYARPAAQALGDADAWATLQALLMSRPCCMDAPVLDVEEF